MNPPANIRSWLEGIGLGELAAIFEENHITPDLLHDLTVDDLREIGVTSLGHRKKLLLTIAGLSAPAAPSVPSEPAPEPQPKSQAVREPLVIRGSAPKPVGASKPAAPAPQQMPVKAAPVKTAAPVIREVAEPEPAPTVSQPVIPAPEPQSIEPPSATAGKKSRRKAFSAKFLTISIALHLIGAAGAGYWVVQKIEAKRKLQFAGGPPTSNPNKRALEHKVSLQKKKNAGGSPAQAKRISVTGLASKITLPEMPAVPTTSTQFVAGRMAGMGGAGFGSGLGFGNGNGMGIGGAGAGGLGLTMFGARGGTGLTGTFYDLKRSRLGTPNGMQREDPRFSEFMKNFVSGWKMPSNVNCYTGRSRLFAKAFMFPAIPDTEAGKAFNEPETQAGMWIAHYSGSVTPPVSGRYRFVGWADNSLFVGVNSKLVLNASDNLNTGEARISLGTGIPIPGKEQTPMPLIAGSWFDLTAGKSFKMDVVVSDSGGIFCAGLLLEKEGGSVATGKYNIPDLPLFLAGPLGAEEKRLYDKYVSDKAFKGPVFNCSGGGSALDVLKR